MTEMKNFIEKMAIIYEIIYPDISFLQAEDKFINDSYVNQVMFKDNKYLNDTLEEETLLEELEWNKFIGGKTNDKKYCLNKKKNYYENLAIIC